MYSIFYVNVCFLYVGSPYTEFFGTDFYRGQKRLTAHAVNLCLSADGGRDKHGEEISRSKSVWALANFAIDPEFAIGRIISVSSHLDENTTLVTGITLRETTSGYL